MAEKKQNNKSKKTPENYGRWDNIGIKVISKPNNQPKKKER